MSHPRRRRCSSTVAAVALTLLVAPAAAQAVNYTVMPGGGDCADLTCGTITAAYAAAGPGDVVNVTPATYAESPTLTVNNVRTSGTAAGVVVQGKITFSGGAGPPNVLEKVFVANSAGSAVDITAGDVTIRDSALVGLTGNGVTITAGNNAIIRSQIFAGGSGSSAVDVSSTTTPLTTTLDSTILGGPGNGNGLKVRTSNALLADAANGTVNARHVTIAGSSTGMRLDATAALALALGSPVGNITVNTTDSIVQGSVVELTNDGVPPLVPANTITTNFVRTDQTTPSAQLFVNPGGRNFHLRADAPVIGQGQTTGGESPTDVDGDDRAAAPTDLGADEFVNKPPTAKIAVTNTPRQSQATQFDAGASTDPEGSAGGGIVAYVFDFGDGTRQTTSSPTVSHVYKAEGTVTARLAVVDRQGGVSAVDSTQLTVLDGTAPAVTISKPTAKQKIKLVTTKTKTVTTNGVKKKVKTSKRTPIRFAGSATDKSGVQSVYITIEKTGGASTTKCKLLDPKTGLSTTSCSKPILIKTTLSSGSWTYKVPSAIKLPKGSYRVIAYGLDRAGTSGNAAAKSAASVSFTLK